MDTCVWGSVTLEQKYDRWWMVFHQNLLMSYIKRNVFNNKQTVFGSLNKLSRFSENRLQLLPWLIPLWNCNKQNNVLRLNSLLASTACKLVVLPCLLMGRPGRFFSLLATLTRSSNKFKYNSFTASLCIWQLLVWSSSSMKKLVWSQLMRTTKTENYEFPLVRSSKPQNIYLILDIMIVKMQDVGPNLSANVSPPTTIM